jgi:hypothetical protein
MNKSASQLPLARTEKLIIKELDDEVLVYDLVSDKAHCLNHTAALVWKNCDGKKSVPQINAAIATEAEAPVDQNVVWLALEQLEKFKLLSATPPPPAIFAGMNRRQVMRGIGLAAIALPAIVSIVAPTAVSAASCGQVCGNPTECPPACGSCAKLTPTSPNKTCN